MMRAGRCILVIVLWAVLTGIVFGVCEAKDKVYTMVCRGGGDMWATYDAEGHGGNVWLRIHFRKAAKSSSEQAPRPGECAWVDRPIGPDEPGILHYGSKSNYIESFEMRGNTFRATRLKGSEIQYLLDAIQNATPFTVRCFSQKRWGTDNYFIDHVGP